MSYLKSLFFNFLTVFFANYLLPGVQVMDQTKIPSLGSDIPFALGLGLLNSLIFPILKIGKQEIKPLRIGLIAFIVNFLAYGLLKLIKVIQIDLYSIEGYLLVAAVVTLGSFIINFLEMKSHRQHHCIHRHHPDGVEPPVQ